MTTETLADTDSTTTDSGERFHYVRRDKIITSVTEGDHVVALCGEVFPVRKVPKAGAPVCGDCQRIYERMAK